MSQVNLSNEIWGWRPPLCLNIIQKLIARGLPANDLLLCCDILFSLGIWLRGNVADYLCLFDFMNSENSCGDNVFAFFVEASES